jgi:uncharacterized protein YebE (UPF0316 family)
MNEFLISALIIFVLRMMGTTFSTLGTLMVVRGRKGAAWIFSLSQALIYITGLSLVLSDLGNWIVILGYALGFATGMVVGLLIENRLAIGYTHLRIISPYRFIETAQGLRDEGYAVTEVSAHGRDGAVAILHCSVLRKYENQVKSIITQLDPEAFITVENVYLVQHGSRKS